MYSLKLRTTSEEYNGVPWSWIIPVGIAGILCVFLPVLFAVLIQALVIRILLVGFAIFSVFMIYTKMRSPARLNLTYKWLLYHVRVQKGEHIIPKHSVPMQFLKGLVPIEDILSSGLIQFTGGRYGILYRVFVPRRAGDELDAFIELVTKNIVNRIHDGQLLKVFETQRYTHEVTIKNQVLKAMNDTSKTREQQEHLESIYNLINKNGDTPTERYIYLFVALGRFDTVEEAHAERENIVNSLNDGLVIAGIRYQELRGSDEIGKAYRRCMK